MKKQPTGKTILPFLSNFICKLTFAAVLLFFSGALIHAQDEGKLQKHRGHITAMDADAKTVTLEKNKGSAVTLKWNDETKLESSQVKAISDLKPGMWLRCIMVGKTDVIERIRHEDELDKSEK